MPVKSRRTRLICFRLNDAEYRKAEEACLSSGMRSVPLLLRQAALEVVETIRARSSGESDVALRRLRAQIDTLSAELDRLNTRLSPALSPFAE